jgi:hypothetical protein
MHIHERRASRADRGLHHARVCHVGHLEPGWVTGVRRNPRIAVALEFWNEVPRRPVSLALTRKGRSQRGKTPHLLPHL